MFKVVFYLWRKQGTTRREFIDYYEAHHAPFVSSHVTLRGYRRNFPRWESARFTSRPLPESSRFDVMAEMWADSADALVQQLLISQQQPLKDEWEADEAKFIDRSRLLLLQVLEEHPAQGLPPHPRRTAKLVRYVWGAGTADAQALNQPVPVGALAARRNRVVRDHPVGQPGGPAVQATDFAKLALARIDEIWADGGVPDLTAYACDMSAGEQSIAVAVDECATDLPEVP